MSIRIAPLFWIQFFLLLLSSSAFGQIVYFDQKTGFHNDVVTGQDFVLYYEMVPKSGSFTLIIHDGEFQEQLSQVYIIGKDFFKVNHEVIGEKVYLLFSNLSNSKLISVIDTKTLEVQFFPFTVNLGQIDRFKIIENTILVVQTLEKGDFVQIYDYRTGILISLSELYYPKTRIWDVQVKDGIFDILVHKKGNYTNQSLKMVGFNTAGSKLYDKEILLTGSSKLIFKSANLMVSEEAGYSIVGTYSKKQGEQFSGYFHVGINDFLEQKLTIHPMRSLDGFFDYKKNPGLRKNAKNLRRDMNLYHSASSGKYIGLASRAPRLVRKFIHFILFDHSGERIYDTSVRFFYWKGETPYKNSTLALIDKDLYFTLGGNIKIKAFPDFSIYQISDGNLSGIFKAKDFPNEKLDNSEWEEVQYYHWKDNEFIVLGIETINGLSRYVIRKIEV